MSDPFDANICSCGNCREAIHEAYKAVAADKCQIWSSAVWVLMHIFRTEVIKSKIEIVTNDAIDDAIIDFAVSELQKTWSDRIQKFLVDGANCEKTKTEMNDLISALVQSQKQEHRQ